MDCQMKCETHVPDPDQGAERKRKKKLMTEADLPLHPESLHIAEQFFNQFKDDDLAGLRPQSLFPKGWEDWPAVNDLHNDSLLSIEIKE